jgi:hypothetical protein
VADPPCLPIRRPDNILGPDRQVEGGDPHYLAVFSIPDRFSVKNAEMPRYATPHCEMEEALRLRD